VQCVLLLFKIISIHNWARVGTVYSKMGGRGKPWNSKNLPRWAAEFGKRRCGIWQNLSRKTVGPRYHFLCWMKIQYWLTSTALTD